MAEPKHVGTWVLVVLPGELTKYGKDGDTEFPYPPDDKEAIKQAQFQFKEKQPEDQVYILHVFDNGQMKQFTWDGE